MKKIKLPVEKITNNLFKYAARYSHMFIFIIFSALAALIMLKIGQYSRSEPSENQIKDKISKITSSKIDEESLTKLKELQDSNVSIESLFDNGRTNPFEN